MTIILTERHARSALPNGPGKGPRDPQPLLGPGPARCAVPGCGARVDPSRLMCRRDWYLVPYDLRARVWATWRSGDGASSPAHRAAVDNAIRARLARVAASTGQCLDPAG
jgi:hypothetical protein